MMVLKQGEVFVVSDDRGDIGRNVLGAGIYFHDTRYLSEYRLLLNDEPPDLLDSSAEHNVAGICQFGNPCLTGQDGHEILPNTIGLKRYRLVEQGVIEQLEVRNFNRFPLTIELGLSFSADFRDLFDIRGFRRMRYGRVQLPRRSGNELTLAYRAPDDTVDELSIRFNRQPDETTIEAGAGYTVDLEELRTMLPGHDRIVRTPPTDRVPRVSVLFRLPLAPQGDARLEIAFSPRNVQRETGAPAVPEMVVAAHPRELGAEHFTVVTTSNEVVNRVVDRSLRDIRTLITPFAGGRLIAAGIPWYVAPFGRDSLITALQTLMFSPDLAVETLRYLARQQGTRVDEWTEEEPGKILHEERFGEMARLREIPHRPYYGSVDGTPLFIILFAELMRWCGSQALYDEFREPIARAVHWIDAYGDKDGDGFVDYGSHNQRGGLVNEGWKDSDNSLQFPDGTPVVTPIALVEVQAYVYLAKRGLADVEEQYGAPGESERLRREAEELRVRFEERFWSEEDQFYGQAIDGSGRLVRAISSNPGHCLYCGIVGPDRADEVARRMRAVDMYSGWGIRTLSTQMPHYNPMSYHNGSVWPHDNSLIVAGLRRYAFDDEAAAVTSDLVAAAMHFDYLRLPELFCGFSREFERYTVPITYPVSCSPQAWAAGSIPLMLQTILGLEPDWARRRLSFNPYFPEWLDEVHLRGLRFGDRLLEIDLCGHGRDVEVSFDVEPDVEIAVNGATVGHA